MSEDDQKKVLASMPKPNGNDYREFHGAVAEDAIELPKEFLEKYKAVKALKGQRGKSVGREAQMREMCKMWQLGRQLGMPLATMWQDAAYTESSYAGHEDSGGHYNEAVPWGIFSARHHSAEAAKQALADGEGEEVDNDGPGPKKLYRSYTQFGGPLYISLRLSIIISSITIIIIIIIIILKVGLFLSQDTWLTL